MSHSCNLALHDGHSPQRVARPLACDEPSARRRCRQVLQFLVELSNDVFSLNVAKPHKLLNADWIDRIHKFRKKNPVFVQCYPVQGEDDWQRMIDIGVDVIQTDFPEALFEYLETQGFKI